MVESHKSIRHLCRHLAIFSVSIRKAVQHQCAMKKIIFNGQRQNKHILIVIYHSSLVKGAMNAARVCKLCNGIKKRLNFFFF